MLAPWADWLYGADAGKFWGWCSGPGRINGGEPDAIDFAGVKIAAWAPQGMVAPQYHDHLVERGVKIIRHCAPEQHSGISPDPGLIYGFNSTHHILSVIHHTGAKRVILLGVDMRATGHWHADWPEGGISADYPPMRESMSTLVEPLWRAGVQVLNASPGSALTCWPSVELLDALR